MLLSLLIVLIIVGAALYIVSIIPMDARVKQIITVLVIVVVAIYALQLLFGASGVIRVP